MNSFYDIDFAQLYKQHLIACRYHDVTAEKWDKKAVKFAETFVEKENSYTRQFLDKMKIEPTDSVLDIGSGPGTLAIPLARLCKQVYALDFSEGMLQLLARYQQQLGLSNIIPIHKSWNDPWDDVPQADIVIASRSTLVADLDEMIDKLSAKAKKRVYLTAITQPHFLDSGIFDAIERDALGFPTYIYLLNRLYQRGIQAELSFLQGAEGEFQGETYQDLQNAVEFSLGALTELERQKLQAFYQQKQQSRQKISHGQARWAFISWQV
ncbi:class I SAM-dependent methyltransferase [Glaesserella sp.]|uniref:class I SAM-dependent methyltransferase n=1 Tax=Glaesserella sp. TaxID=2094731 RepID=UPI0035A0A94A